MRTTLTLDDDVAACLRGPLDLLGAHVGRSAGDDDLDAVVVEELVLGLVLARVDTVLLHQASGLLWRPVVDAHDLGERYPTIDDPDRALAGRFDIRGIPTTIVADSRGRLRFEVFGPLHRGELERLVRRVRR